MSTFNVDYKIVHNFDDFEKDFVYQIMANEILRNLGAHWYLIANSIVFINHFETIINLPTNEVVHYFYGSINRCSNLYISLIEYNGTRQLHYKVNKLPNSTSSIEVNVIIMLRLGIVCMPVTHKLGSLN